MKRSIFYPAYHAPCDLAYPDFAANIYKDLQDRKTAGCSGSISTVHHAPGELIYPDSSFNP